MDFNYLLMHTQVLIETCIFNTKQFDKIERLGSTVVEIELKIV